MQPSKPVAFLLPKSPVQLQKEPAAASASCKGKENLTRAAAVGAQERRQTSLCVCVSVAQSTLFIRDPVNLLGTLALKATVPAAAQVLPPSQLPFLRPAKSVGSSPS